eukprot:907625-Rhodomonas_salina.1
MAQLQRDRQITTPNLLHLRYGMSGTETPRQVLLLVATSRPSLCYIRVRDLHSIRCFQAREEIMAEVEAEAVELVVASPSHYSFAMRSPALTSTMLMLARTGQKTSQVGLNRSKTAEHRVNSQGKKDQDKSHKSEIAPVSLFDASPDSPVPSSGSEGPQSTTLQPPAATSKRRQDEAKRASASSSAVLAPASSSTVSEEPLQTPSAKTWDPNLSPPGVPTGKRVSGSSRTQPDRDAAISNLEVTSAASRDQSGTSRVEVKEAATSHPPSAPTGATPTAATTPIVAMPTMIIADDVLLQQPSYERLMGAAGDSNALFAREKPVALLQNEKDGVIWAEGSPESEG